MMKAIFARDARVGDTVAEFEGKPITIAEIRPNVGSLNYRRVEFWDANGIGWVGPEFQIIGLLHRPLPKDETEATMLEKVRIYGWAVHRMSLPEGRPNVMGDEYINRLQQALEDYRLGMPRSAAPQIETAPPSPEPAHEKGTAGGW